MNRWATPSSPATTTVKSSSTCATSPRSRRSTRCRCWSEAAELASPRFGLINEAIALLLKEGEGDPQAQLLLGDLLLREGVMDSSWPADGPNDVCESEAPCRPGVAALHASGGVRLGRGQALARRRRGRRNWPPRPDQPAVKFYRHRLAQELGDVETVRRYLRDAGPQGDPDQGKGLR